MISELSQAAYILLLVIFVPIPYSTDQKNQTRPYLTYLLIAVNSLVFFGWIFPAAGTDHQRDIFAAWGVVPRVPGLLPLVTSLFLHVSPTHLIWNMAFLWVFGPSCEDTLGHFVYVVFYLAGGVVAGLLHTAIVLLFAENSAVAFAPLVGASGAIAALVGMYALRFYRSKLRLIWICASILDLRNATFEIPAIFGVSVWFLQNLFGAVLALFQPDRNGIAYWAHIGGFIFGMAVAEASGLMGEGMNEYLFDDAVTDQNRGEEGVRSAILKYKTLLQKRPHDPDVRKSLSIIAEQSDNGSPARRVVAEAYAALSSSANLSGDHALGFEWLERFDGLGGEEIVSAQQLFALAEAARVAEKVELAERFYLKIADRHAGSPEALHSGLQLTAMWMESSWPLSVPLPDLLSRVRAELRAAR